AGAMSRTPWRVAASGGLPWAAPGEADVRHIVRDHGRCAAVAVEGGYDGVEIDATHRALPGQFLESGNDRGDGWGGAALNRRRLLVEIVQAVRGAVPDRIAVAVRLDSDVTTRTGMGSAEVHAAVLGSGADLVTEIGGGVVRVLARR
uniref:oxidoreductase n=1 Tax=Kribbia dieselivorans TaxID=331526 RepID=UPI003F933A3C